ncbi:44427_t:CDS:2 [Gigaspora margarita]|uniref:44427_t:CDS:1 n=1 Tax=Gigaspora margarita TaxID=4874 RepID=A0ABM8VVG2_GIGMA|nr:44427_t:CDS:2 [Gigaspora margarita]
MVGRLGEIRYSILNQEQFQELYGKEWILMDGSSILGSDLEKKFGWTSVPDARGLFLRCKNNGRNDGLENPSGELALGQYQTDNLKSHNHVGLFINNLEGQWGQAAYQGEIPAHRLATQPADLSRSFYTGYTGEQETCPKSVTVNTFIKINFSTQYESCEGLKYEISQYFNKLEQSHQQKFSKLLNKSDKQDISEVFWQLIKPLLLPNRPIDDSNLLFIYEFFYIMLAGYSYRSADGSDYSRINLYSEIGKAGSRYSRLTRIRKFSKSELPEANDIFNSVMKRIEFNEHPSGISANLFYLAILITHDLFNTSHKDLIINLNSSYLDLSTLYGSNQKQQNKVRTFKNGQLKPDTFADPRILLQPPGVGSMLILFSRNHNYIAEQLKRENKLRLDEDLFQTARLINCGYYMKIIIQNYFRTILGLDQTTSEWYLDPRHSYNDNWLLQSLPTGTGNQISLEFNYVYQWHSVITEDDTIWVERKFREILQQDDIANIDPDEFYKNLEKWVDELDEDPFEWTFDNMRRNSDGRYADFDIAINLIKGTENVAGAFGARGIPEIFRIIEISGIKSARDLGLCSLNDFRRFLNLKPYSSFEDMLGLESSDNQILKDLKRLYNNNIENVELYPGLMTEKTKPANNIGSMIALPYTISRAILSDTVNLIRNDRFYADELNQYNSALWD